MKRLLTSLTLTVLCSLSSAEEQWAHTGPNQGNHGTNVQQLFDSGLLKQPVRPLLVAVIDSGFDLDHEDMQGIWYTNASEAAGQAGVDDDRNGYIDDVQGWNFVGGKDGTQVVHGRLELVREIKRLETLAAESELNNTQQQYLSALNETLIKQRAQHAESIMQPYAMLMMFRAGKHFAEKHKVDPTDAEALAQLPATDIEEFMARESLLMLLRSGMQPAVLQKGLEQRSRSMLIHFDKNYSESAIIGDDPAVMDDIGYGNTILNATRGHGTSVTSLIAANTANDIGIKGQCPPGYIQILPIRAVPDGDERDKDVANALRYAVDQGAKVVNMSFGKYYSPNKAYVDAAFAYALEKGVLIVIGAGNDGVNISEKNSYPNAFPVDHEKHGYPQQFQHVIAVGASGNNEMRSLVPYWTNYSKERVLLFAPGADVLCAAPDDKYEVSDGTSLSAPIVSGVAALLWSQFPEKSWSDIKTALEQGVRTYPDATVRTPGTRRGNSKLADLSVTGGIVDAWRSYHLLKDGQLPGARTEAETAGDKTE